LRRSRETKKTRRTEETRGREKGEQGPCNVSQRTGPLVFPGFVDHLCSHGVPFNVSNSFICMLLIQWAGVESTLPEMAVSSLLLVEERISVFSTACLWPYWHGRSPYGAHRRCTSTQLCCVLCNMRSVLTEVTS